MSLNSFHQKVTEIYIESHCASAKRKKKKKKQYLEKGSRFFSENSQGLLLHIEKWDNWSFNNGAASPIIATTIATS